MTAVVPADRGALLGPLRSRPFRMLAGARVVDVLGNAVAPVALVFAVLQISRSATDLGLVVGARSLANVAFLLLGGVVADRVPRHVLLVGSSLAAAATQGAVAATVLGGSDSIGLLAGLSAGNGAVAAFALPAAAALQPQTVSRDQLQQANALARIGVSGAGVLGAALGGLLVAAVGPGWGIAVDAGSFLGAAVLFSRVRVPAAAGHPAAVAHQVWLDLATGWDEFRSRTWLWTVVVAFLVINAVIGATTGVLGPLIASRSFGPRAWGLILAAHAAGYIVGGVIALRLRIHRLLGFGMACTGAEALFVLALALSPAVGVTVAAAFLGGLGVEQFGVAWETSMQQHIPPDRLARVYSYDMLGSLIAIPLGQMAAGPLSAAAGLTPTLIAGSALILTATAAATATRAVHRLPNTALATAPAPTGLPDRRAPSGATGHH